MESAIVKRGPIAASEREQHALEALDRLFAADRDGCLKLVGPDREEIELPQSVCDVLRQVVDAMARDEAVAVVPVHKLLTTQEAADLLDVSRPYLVRLLDEGQIPFSRTGSHRRIRLNDLIAFKTQRDERRRAGLARLTRMSREMGLYSNS